MNRLHLQMFCDIWTDSWYMLIDPDQIDLTRDETHVLTLLEGNYNQGLGLLNVWLAHHEVGEIAALRLDGVIDKRKNKLYTRLWRRRIKALQAHYRSVM